MRACLLPLFLALGTFAVAQEARPVKCRFLAFKGKEAKTSVLTVSSSGAQVTCPLPANNLSKPIVCFAENNTIGFVNETGGKIIAKATIPAGVNSAFLVFVPGPAEAAPATPAATGSEKTAQAAPRQDATPSWRVLVIADTPQNFPDGGAYIANFYNSDIRFIVGEHKGMLKAGGAHGYAMPKKLDEFNMAPTVFELQKGDKWRCASESALRFLPGMRYLIFAYQDPVTGRARINTYQDIAETPAVVAQTGGTQATTAAP